MVDDVLDAFFDEFYRDPNPALACRALELAAERNWFDEYPISLYGFARAVDRYQPVRTALEDLAMGDEADATAASRVLEAARSMSFSRALEMPEEPEPAWMDVQWIEFGITGDESAVERIISVLDWPDVARQRLEAWLLDVSGADWDAQPYAGYRDLFVRILFPVDYDEGTVDGPVDIDLLIAMQARDGQLKFDELPFEYSGDAPVRAAMKSAAVWSLTAKARDDPAVARLCAKAAPEKGGAARFLLASEP